MYNLCII